MAVTYTVMPWIREQFFDNNGKPAAGFQLFTYAAGTSTKQATYTDSAASVASSNPIILDAAGCPASAIFLQPLSYKFVLAPPTDSDPPAAPIWSEDNIAATPPFNVDVDVTGVAGGSIAVNACVYISDGSGGRTAGRWYEADADFDYASTLPSVMGFATVAALGSATVTVRRMGRLTGLSGLSAGADYYVSSASGAITSTAPTNPRRVGRADSTTSLVIAAEIPQPLKGFIDIPLASWREIAANVIPVTASDAGVLSSNTTPIFNRINGATDKGLRLQWAAANVDELTASFNYPPDLDDAAVVEFHMLAASGGATNSPTVQVDYFEGLGDTNAGGATGAVTGTTITEYTRTIAAADVGAPPNFASVSLTPAAHGTDVLNVYGTWVEYTRRLRST